MIARAVNALLRRRGVRLVRTRSQHPWDTEFLRWIAEAKASGVDPNDVGDRAWQGEALKGASRDLFPRITPITAGESRFGQLDALNPLASA